MYQRWAYIPNSIKLREITLDVFTGISHYVRLILFITVLMKIEPPKSNNLLIDTAKRNPVLSAFLNNIKQFCCTLR